MQGTGKVHRTEHLQPHLQSPPLKRHQLVEPCEKLSDLQPIEPEPVTRAGFLKYSQCITLDPNTANICMSLPEGNRKVTCEPGFQSYSPGSLVPVPEPRESMVFQDKKKPTDWIHQLILEPDLTTPKSNIVAQQLTTETISSPSGKVKLPCSWSAGEMMQPKDQPERDWFSCLLCLNLLKESVTLQCGHSFCLNCLKTLWDKQDARGVYNCPRCRKTFKPRPEVNVNEMLDRLVETLRKKNRLQAPPAGPGDVACGVCTGSKLKAVQSCLVCLVSYCSEHLQPHLQSPPLKRHQLVEPCESLLDLQKLEPEPETRSDFLRYSQAITLDPNSANKHLLLSEGNRKITHTTVEQIRPDHPDRFTVWSQVLSKESLSGRGYWEVEWTEGGVGVAVAYKNIQRAGSSEECDFGFNNNSWVLHRGGNSYNFYHGTVTAVSGPLSSRVGVYLDHRAGVLSFYSVSDTMTLIHRVHATFTQPLCAGVRLYCDGSAAEFCPLK